MSSLTFNTQKNRQRGEVIAHARSSHTHACPTHALARRLFHIRSFGGSASTYLCSYATHPHHIRTISASQLTTFLREAAIANPTFGINSNRLEARSLRAGGAMALLCGGIDTDVIKLVGCWCSDAMFRYLHAQTIPVINQLASTMLQHGAFTFAPGTAVPTHVATFLASIPVNETAH